LEPLRLPLALVFITALSATGAEVNGAPGILRGLLQEVLTSRSGELRIRSGPDTVIRCEYDAITFFERLGHTVTFADLRPADPVEIVSDRKDSMPCYARIVRVQQEPEAGYRPRTRPPQPSFDTWLERGDTIMSGVVLRLYPESMTVRLRSGEQKTLLLRADTRYVDSGVITKADQLRANTRVSIRAGQNLEKKLEAYQIMWGEIDGPSVRQSQ